MTTNDELRAVATELLPCPFCGSAARMYGQETPTQPAWKLIRVHCPSCLTSSANYGKFADAIAAWNRRASIVPSASSPTTYPCDRCGKLRTKDEGGTVFTVCDGCWNVTTSAPTNERVELPHRAMSCGHCRCNLVDVQTGDLCGACERLGRIAEIIERNGYVCRDGSPSTFGSRYQSILQIYKLATEELGRSQKEKA